MRVSELKNSLEDYAKDNKLNLSSLISQENYSGLDKKHVWGISLACAYALENQKLIEPFEDYVYSETASDDIFEQISELAQRHKQLTLF